MRNQCLKAQQAEHDFGYQTASALATLLANIEAVDDVEELESLLGEDVRLSSDGNLVIAVNSKYRANFIPSGTKFVVGADEVIAWQTVKRLKLMSIVQCP